MPAGLDTSVVIRLLTGEPEGQAREALRWLRQVRSAGDTPVVSDLVASEAYFALQYHFGVPKAAARRQLALFLGSEDVQATGVAARVLAAPRLASPKPGLADRLIHRQYLAEGTEGEVAFQKAARALPRARVLAVAG